MRFGAPLAEPASTDQGRTVGAAGDTGRAVLIIAHEGDTPMQYPLNRPEVADEARREQHYQNEQAERLNTFRAKHRAMGMLYRLLDVGYGVEIAVGDVSRLTTRAALAWALAFDAALCLLFFTIWWRYDLMSTWNALNPLAEGLIRSIPREGEGWGQFMAVAGFIVDFLIRIVVTLGPSLIQFRMPYLAMQHDAAWLALWVTAVFDMGTDSVDVRNDVPAFFGWLINAANGADAMVWWSLIGLALLLLVVQARRWPLWLGLIVVCVAALFFGQAGNMVFWANVGFWTFFASFAAQSLFMVQLAKCGLLLHKLRYVQAVRT